MNKKFLILFSVFVFSMCLEASAQFVYGDHVIKVLDLPNTEEFIIKGDVSDNQFELMGTELCGDLGIAHKQFCIVFPLWNYGEPKYVLYRDKNMYDASSVDYYSIPLSDEDIAYFHELYGIPLTPQIPFWDKWGGKLVILLLLILFLVWDSKR